MRIRKTALAIAAIALGLASGPAIADLVRFNYTGLNWDASLGGLGNNLTGSIAISCAGPCTGTYTTFSDIALRAGSAVLDTDTGAIPFPFDIPVTAHVTFGPDGRIHDWAIGLASSNGIVLNTSYPRCLQPPTTCNQGLNIGSWTTGSGTFAQTTSEGPPGAWSTAVSVPSPIVGSGPLAFGFLSLLLQCLLRRK